MEISQHIKKLLVSNERVILKDFGAFITKQVSARFDKETGTMKPPYKTVIFDSSIKEDEGSLSEYIATQEGFTQNASEELINEFVKTVKNKLSSGQTVDFKELGTFKQAQGGEVEFAFSSENNLLPDSFGLTEVSISDKKDVTSSNEKTEKKPVVDKKSVKRKEPIKKEKPKVIEKKKTAPKPKVEKKRKPKVKKEKQSGEKKKRRILPFFLILLLAIGLVLAAIYFFKPNLWAKGYNFSTEKIAFVKQMFKKDGGKYDIIDPDKEDKTEAIENDTNSVTTTQEEEYTDEDDIVSADEDVDTSFEDDSPADNEDVATEDVVSEDATVEDVATEEVSNSVNNPQKGKYYIIVGSVKSEASAKKEQKRFSRKGITTSIIYASNNRYRISIGEFSSAKEAQNFYSDIQAKHGNIEAWVWEKK